MDWHNVGIRDIERRIDQHLREGRGVVVDVGMTRGNNEAFRTLSQVNDQGLSNREAATSLKFEWNNLLNESRKISEFDGMERGGGCSRELVNGRYYDGLVERSLPIEVERTRNVSNYGPNVRVSEHRECAMNVNGLLVSDSDDLGVRVRVRECPPCMEREIMRRPYNEGIERDGSRFCSEDGSCILSPRSQSSGRQTPIDGIPRGSLEGLCHDVKHHHADGFVRVGSIPCIRHNSLTPRSHYSRQQTPFEAIPSESLEGLHQDVYCHCADGFESGGSISSSRGNNLHQGPYSSAGATTHPFPAESICFPRVEYSPDEGRSTSYTRQESERSQNVYQRSLSRDRYEDIREYCDQADALRINAEDPSFSRRRYSGNLNVIPRSLSRDSYKNNQDILDYYDVEDANGNSVEDLAVHRRHYTEYSDESVFLENGLQPAIQPLQETPLLENYNQSRAGYEIGYGYEREILSSRNTYVGRDGNHENLHCQEHYGYPSDYRGMLYNGQNSNIPTLDGVLVEERGQQYGGLVTLERPKKMLKRKYGFGKDAGPSFRSISCHDKHYGRANVGIFKTENGQSFAGLSEDLQKRLSKPHDSDRGRGDVKKLLKHPHAVTNSHKPHLPWGKKNAKKRVKPSPNDIHATSAVQNFGKAKGISSYKKLKLAPKTVLCQSAAPDSEVLNSGHNAKKPQKLTAKDLGRTKEAPSSRTADSNHSILKVKPTGKDLPEDSEDFRRQVETWFLKSMEHLNANIGRLRKFKEQSNGGSLKCIICSSSTEFPDTKGVAMHAFKSLKVGYRAPHLGFHKALCVLMGWDSGAVAHNGRWTCQSLPEAEAWTLKESIIIWPPVFIIHNRSSRNYSHNEQAKVSAEQLEKILKGMGFSDGNTKVCHAKPGNPNIMVVKFSGTLSGLKEAERLHNVFAEKKHGRAELQQIDAGGSCCKGIDQKPEDEIQDQLYGYLGIIEDLDKLNCDTKRCYRARNKKEILASVDAAL